MSPLLLILFISHRLFSFVYAKTFNSFFFYSHRHHHYIEIKSRYQFENRKKNNTKTKKCTDEKQTIDGVMEVGLEDVVVEVSSAKKGILPSKYLTICRLARGLLNEFQSIIKNIEKK
jgi:hypothetical protein